MTSITSITRVAGMALVFMLTATAAAQWPDESPLSVAVQEYHAQLALRSDPATHNAALRQALDRFDGLPVAESFAGDVHFVMVWDAAEGQPVVFADAQLLTISVFTDDYGRIALEAASFSAWLDLEGLRLHVEVTLTADDVYHTWVDLPPDGEPAPPPIIIQPANRKKCVCKGSNNECPGKERDCQDLQPCTLPNGNGSNCIFAFTPDHCPEQDPNHGDGPCFEGATPEAAAILGILALVTSCGPLRRRLGLPVRRPSRPS